VGFHLHPLPVSVELETTAVLRQAARSHRALAELKGAAASIPNETILIDTLALQEAKDSSAIENIITTEDDLFQGDVISGQFPSPAAKEVYNYTAALKIGLQRVRQQGFLRLDDVLAIQAALEGNRAGLRKLPGTVLKNEQTGEVIYEPPQDPAAVERLIQEKALLGLMTEEASSPQIAFRPDIPEGFEDKGYSITDARRGYAFDLSLKEVEVQKQRIARLRAVILQLEEIIHAD
jgi:Fic family protein